MKDSMVAIYTTAPGQFGLTTRPVPVLHAGEVLIEIACCGICHTDVMIRAGKAGHVKYPFIPGHECSGTIVAAAVDVKDRFIGQRGVIQQIINCGSCKSCRAGKALCMCEKFSELGSTRDGAMAKYCVIPAQNFLPIPDEMSFEEAACVEPLANACHAIEAAKVCLNDTVVVIGPGAIGIMAAKVARSYGAGRVILVGTRDTRLDLAMKNDFGVNEAVNIRHPNAVDDLQNGLLKGRGADVVIEAAGSRSALELAFKILAPGGRIVLEGTPDPQDTIPFNMFSLPNEGSIVRVAGWSASNFLNALELITNRLIDVRPLITHRYSLSQWEEGFDKATNDKDSALKVVLNLETEV